MQVESFAEHPEEVARQEVLRRDVQRTTPQLHAAQWTSLTATRQLQLRGRVFSIQCLNLLTSYASKTSVVGYCWPALRARYTGQTELIHCASSCPIQNV